MNNFLKDLAAQRQKFLDGLDANKGDINLDIFEDFYPDQAHFLLELLQNAEDVEATEATFEIYQHGCSFTHNGKRTFNTDDVRAITGIHNSTKIKAVDQIGKFGVGFKAVFVYTLSPEIFSGEFAFRILRLVFPKEVSGDRCLGADTRFWLPFDNPRKVAAAAFTEIRDNLSTLSDTTLLFLSHLELIGWQVDGAAPGEIMRVQHSDNHFEVRRQVGGETATSSHFLKFDQPVVGLEKQRIAVAFALDALPNVQSFDPTKPLAKQFRITSANPGRVAVYFSAEKETSGLRFHLHAPFVPELSRASIKETPANQPLFEQLAALTVTALPQIRDLGLLTTDFLAVLPNPQDAVPPRYEPIRNAIVEAMNTELLTPTHARSHEPANRLLQAPASLKDLLSAEDLEFLVDHDGAPPLWAIAAPQKNSNADRFLEGLAIRKWDTEQFVDLLGEKTSDEDFMAWLAAKPVEWHQKLYALLNENLASLGWRKDGLRKKLKKTKLIRLADGQYIAGSNCFFPSDDGKDDDGLPRVDKGVYTSGRSKQQQENARKFLEEMGVREVGEAERIEAILKQRYASPNVKSQKGDLKRFIALVEKEPDKATLFKDYFILQGQDETWRKPEDIFLDEPFMDTGLSSYYDALVILERQGDQETEGDEYCYNEPCDTELAHTPLASSYVTCGVFIDKLVKFAAAVGTQTHLKPTQTSTGNHPHVSELREDYSRYGTRWTSSAIDVDWEIPHLSEALKDPSVKLALLVWKTISDAPPTVLEAQFRPNQQYQTRRIPSSLALLLQRASWVPQNDGRFVRPADASRDLLPSGFTFDPGWNWLKAIHFGAAAAKKSEQHRQKQAVAEELGVSLDDIEMINQHPDDFQQWKDFVRAKAVRPAFPERTSADPRRREARVSQQWQEASVKEYDRRERSVRTSRTTVDPHPWLVDYYTNDDEQMVCQLCGNEMPFRKRDGQYYFEAMEAMGPEQFSREHEAQFLALCPVCAAKYNEFVKSDDDTLAEMRRAMLDSDEPSIQVMLGSSAATLRFVEVHFDDLKTILKKEEAEGAAAETD
ncbi:hypothetical protein [Accumulibacter sp.]|uniref:sacsin N-terminal ATP-binding-like domain-containing protein n=1 Tax=Accumulibacter sp. TaxID=2053492 RepID=UPI0025F89327|nr:hypothetical protein [Accumulibacter sp.]MCM8627676.1 hypothetical protein [Accumulibacter sp.]